MVLGVSVSTEVKGPVAEAEESVRLLISEVGVIIMGWLWKLLRKKKGREVRGEGFERRPMVGKERKKRDMAMNREGFFCFTVLWTKFEVLEQIELDRCVRSHVSRILTTQIYKS